MRNSYAEMPVRDLSPSDYNPNMLKADQSAQLVDEVRRQGHVLKPVVVRIDGDGRHCIVDGEHNWRAAVAAGLATVPVEVIEVDDFEVRRQTFKRNLTGTTHKVKQGRGWQWMMATGRTGMLGAMGVVGMSGRELADELGVSEGTVRNTLLYAKAADLCAGRDDVPDEDVIAAMGVREVRALIAQLEGGDYEDEVEAPKPAPDEPAATRVALRHQRQGAGRPLQGQWHHPESLRRPPGLHPAIDVPPAQRQLAAAPTPANIEALRSIQ